MEIEQPGHVYIVKDLDGEGTQRLSFCRRSSRMVDYGGGEHPGTNTQEILRVIIDLAKIVENRTGYLRFIGDCNESGDAQAFANAMVDDARMCLYSYEVRAFRRKRDELNKKEGKHEDEGPMNAHRTGFDDIPFTNEDIENLPVGEDGHLLFK